jgi:hypothetical protein
MELDKIPPQCKFRPHAVNISQVDDAISIEAAPLAESLRAQSKSRGTAAIQRQCAQEQRCYNTMLLHAVGGREIVGRYSRAMLIVRCVRSRQRVCPVIDGKVVVL